MHSSLCLSRLRAGSWRKETRRLVEVREGEGKGLKQMFCFLRYISSLCYRTTHSMFSSHLTLSDGNLPRRLTEFPSPESSTSRHCVQLGIFSCTYASSGHKERCLRCTLDRLYSSHVPIPKSGVTRSAELRHLRLLQQFAWMKWGADCRVHALLFGKSVVSRC